MGQAVAGAVDAVIGIRAENRRAGERRTAHDVAEQFAVGVVLVALVGELQAVAFCVIPTDFAQHVFGGVVERVGFCASRACAADVASGVGGLTVAAPQVQQAVNGTGTPGEGGAALPAVIAAVVAGLEAGVGVIALFQVIGGVLGQVADRTADGIAAVQRRRRAADDFHLLDGVEVDVIAAHVLERTERIALRYAHTVDLGQHAVAVDAADVRPGQTETAAGAAHRNARLVTHHILEVLVVLLIDFTLAVHRHGTRHLQQSLLGAGGGHADGIELGDGFCGEGQRRRKQQQGQPGTQGEWRVDRHLTFTPGV